MNMSESHVDRDGESYEGMDFSGRVNPSDFLNLLL